MAEHKEPQKSVKKVESMPEVESIMKDFSKKEVLREEREEPPLTPPESKWDFVSKLNVFLAIFVAVLLIYNQVQISSLSTLSGGSGATGAVVTSTGSFEEKDVSSIDLSSLKSTGHSVAALFPVEGIRTAEDAIAVMIPAGTPDYGPELGVSFDDPVRALSLLSGQVYPTMLQEIKSDQAAYQRYLNIVTKPVGISCEYCCGVGPVGAKSDGSSLCGCQHNPALLGLTMWLVKFSDYSDGEIIREALKWKSLFFPKDMTQLALTVAGGDTSSLADLPGMVGGC